MAAIMTAMRRMRSAGRRSGRAPPWTRRPSEEPASARCSGLADPEIGAAASSRSHHAARDIVRARTGAKVGWTIADRRAHRGAGGEEKLREIRYGKEDVYLEARARRRLRRRAGPTPASRSTPTGWSRTRQQPDNTLVGTAYRPDALAMAVRHAREVTAACRSWSPRTASPPPTTTQRIAYTDEALRGLLDAMADGVDVRGYLHWSLLDNFEWGHWAADLRAHRGRPRDLRPHAQAEPRVARRGRAPQRAGLTR